MSSSPGKAAGPSNPDLAAGLVGRVLDDRFALKALLGSGGMGTVYRAEQFSMNRDVAVKVLNSGEQDERTVRRFMTEARAASRLKSPHTVTVFDFGCTSDGILYIAMELMEGRTLAQVQKDQKKPFGLVRATRMLNQVLDSIEEAHDFGILHRDVKPENVFLLERPGSRDFVKVLDFGVAKMVGESRPGLTNPGVSFGTPLYMSPEQMLGGEVGPATDLYSVAILLFEMLAGVPPMAGLGVVELALRKSEGGLPRLQEVNPEAESVEGMDEFLARATAPDPSMRPPDVETFRDELNRMVRKAGHGARTRPPPRPGTQVSVAEVRSDSDREALQEAITVLTPVVQLPSPEGNPWHKAVENPGPDVPPPAPADPLAFGAPTWPSTDDAGPRIPTRAGIPVIGAGPTGVELAGTIAELAHDTLRGDFRNIDTRSARVILVEAGPRILAGFSEDLSAYAERALNRLGVEVRLGQPVSECRADGIVLGG